MEPIMIPLHSALIFTVVLARVGGLVTFAPFWAHQATPVRVRALLALALALVITPAVAPRLPTPPSELGALTLMLAGGILLRRGAGFVGRAGFNGAGKAAHLLGLFIGVLVARPNYSAAPPANAALRALVAM